MKREEIETFLNKPKERPSFESKEDAIRTIQSITGSMFIQDRKFKEGEYDKILDALLWMQLSLRL